MPRLQENQSGVYHPACYPLGFEVPQVGVCGRRGEGGGPIPTVDPAFFTFVPTPQPAHPGLPWRRAAALPAQNFPSLLEGIKAFL